MGIGGGIINTPIFKMFGYPIKVAIGSSAAIGFLIALIGAIGFAISGSYLNIEFPLSIRICKYSCIFNICTNHNVYG